MPLPYNFEIAKLSVIMSMEAKLSVIMSMEAKLSVAMLNGS